VTTYVSQAPDRGPTVYVVQQVLEWSDKEGRLVPKFDMSPAREHGEVVYLLSPSAKPFDRSVIAQLRHGLRHFGTHEGDSILGTGSPVLIAAAAAIAAQEGDGKLTVLQWNRERQGYRRVMLDLW